ncbi:MAG: ATP-dependent RecD-like DNA helicase [Acidobacteria bacterium]|nr:ATP-dependent RecD-like DNA helicase [Acidobacteriota bacterium]
MSNNNEKLIELIGSVKRITFHNPSNGWSVLRLNVKGSLDEVTVTGSFSAITPGENLTVSGFWINDTTYGFQFKAISYQISRPATLVGIEKYLGSGLIKGVGPVTARRIVQKFGLDTLDIIEADPDRLKEVYGISAFRITRIKNAWVEQKEIRNIMTFLTSHNVSSHFAVKIFKQYGKDTIKTIETNPYQLARDIYGIGFKSADKIALNLGLARDSQARLRAGISHVLYEATEDGHCFLPKVELLERATTTLEVPDEALFIPLIEVMTVDKELYKVEVPITKEAIYVGPLFLSERATAMRLLNFNHPIAIDLKRVDKWLTRFCEKESFTLSEEQKESIIKVVSSGVSVITGGPGCGKTTTVRALVKLLQAMGKKVLLASPTGRAAQRLGEVTGREAKTIHRLLEFDPTTFSFKHDTENPLEGDVFIIDESSMIDILLANSLLKAIPSDAQICFVGDADQLPSVGPGQFLQDVIESNVIPVARLTQVFRQAAASNIISYAHKINQAQMPEFARPGSSISDCYLVEETDPEKINALVIKIVTQSIPKKFQIHSQQIQVLAPMKRGSLGTTNLNIMLQEAINPASDEKTEVKWGITTYRIGDRVIQQVNNYQLEVFNGDIGHIKSIDLEDRQLEVSFNDKTITYDFSDIHELSLAYAISVHRSQGSEYPAIVMPIHFQHWNLLNRSIVYTGLTRAKKLAILIGQTGAIKKAIKQNSSERYTNLAETLRVGKTGVGIGKLW